jgi:hypothetical protein
MAHLFFDFSCVPTDEPSLQPDKIEAFYKTLPDGTKLFEGDTSLFEPVKKNL